MTGGANDDFERLLNFFHSKRDKYLICGLSPKGENEIRFKKYCDEWSTYTSGFFPVSAKNLLEYFGFIKIYFLQKKEIKNILRNKKYDLCIVNVVVLFWVTMWLWRKKFNNLIFIRENIQPNIIRNIIYKFMKIFGKYFITVSHSLKDDFVRVTGVKNIKTIYSAIENNSRSLIDESKFLELLKKENLESLVTENMPKFVCIGSICDLKNQRMILQAAKILEEKGITAIFVFIGEISDREYYENLLKFLDSNKLESKIFFLGQREKQFVYSVLSHMTGLIISSKTEGMPLVMVESLCFGLPLIATGVGGIKDIIRNEYNGILIKHNPKILADAIMTLLNDSTLYSKLKDNGFETYKMKFNLEKNLVEVEKIVEQLTLNNGK